LFISSTSLFATEGDDDKKKREFLDKEGLVVIPEQDEKPKYTYKPLTLKVNEDGSQYVRFIVWHQQWLSSSNLNIEDAKLQAFSTVRRSRFLAYAQLHPNVLILTHWGLNGLTPGNLTSLGNNSDAPQLFLHGAWTEFKISDGLYIGTGLHYWKGLTRLASQSTLNFMALDQPRPFAPWHSLGITDQFARHLGVYAKGAIGQFNYRFAINNPGRSPLGEGLSFGDVETDLVYNGVNRRDNDDNPLGNTIIEGYFSYNFEDQESTKLPYWVGSYLGTKNIVNVGVGFFSHANGMYNTSTNEHENVFHIAADVFIDKPLNDQSSLTAYASVTNFNYGENYMSRWAGTGTNVLLQAGIYFKYIKFMPYVTYQNGAYEALNDNLSSLDVGFNYYVMGHSAKISLEYHSINNFRFEGGVEADGTPAGLGQIRAQAHIFF
ncbi:MAG: hypothetical protein AAGC88_01885, partial [Bacteroidota bacterium]